MSVITEIEAIRFLIARTASLLDEEDFESWVALFAGDGTYEMSAYSTEIRRWMTWQLSDKSTLASMLGDVKEHVRDQAKRRHVMGFPQVEVDGAVATATAAFSLFRTSPEGQTSLYMVGSYEDRLVKSGRTWLYREHKVIIDTRMLDMFTHVPV